MINKFILQIQLIPKNSKIYKTCEICTLNLLWPIEQEKKYDNHISVSQVIKSMETTKLYEILVWGEPYIVVSTLVNIIYTQIWFS
jgi:hypothetical protein